VLKLGQTIQEVITVQEKDKMHSGELYLPNDKDIMAEQLLCLEKLYDFNATRPTEYEKREKMLKEMFAEIGDGCYIEPPFHSNWGGKHCHFGKNVYANFNLTLVDDTHIYIGDYTMIGPNVTVATAGHPILPELRQKGYQYNFPVTIGKNCWIGAGSVIVPGITIMVIESRNSVNLHYFDTKSLIWSQIFFENLSMSIAMNIGRIEFL
jgi:galactoside O-acetyltransferase